MASYYQCTGYSGQSVDKCYSPSSIWNDTSESTNMSHEIRLSSPSDWRMRFVGGLFYEERELEATTDWHYKSVPECPDTGVSTGSCFLYLDPRSDPKFQSAVPDMSNPNRRRRHRLLQRFQARVHAVGGVRVGRFRHSREPDPDPGHALLRHRELVRRREHGQLLLQGVRHGRDGPLPRNAVRHQRHRAGGQQQQADGFRSRANLTWRVTATCWSMRRGRRVTVPAVSTAARPAALRIRPPISTSGASRCPTIRTT